MAKKESGNDSAADNAEAGQPTAPSPAAKSTLWTRLDANLPLRLLGFGLIYAWSTCLWDIPLMADGSLAALQGEGTWFVSAAITPLTCLAIALAGRTRNIPDTPRLGGIGAVLCSVGTIAVLASEYADGVGAATLTVFAGIGTGCGPALLILAWTTLFTRLDMGVVETVVPASFITTLLCALVIPSLPAAAGLVLLTLLPLVSGALFAFSRHAFDVGRLPKVEAADEDARNSVNLRSFARMMVLVVAVYLIACSSGAMSPEPMASIMEASATVLGMFFAVALSVGVVLFARRINITSVYRWITVPFVIGLIATALEGSVAAMISRVAMNVVFTGIEIIVVLYVVRLTQKSRRPAAFFVGWGECAGYAGVFFGYLLQPLVISWIATPAQAVFGCLVLMGLFALTSLLVPQDEELLTAQQEQRDPLLATTEGTSSAPEPAVAESYQTELDAILAHRTAVAAEHGLSVRETEIFLLLAQGRSRPYIRDSLFLSKNTVATHIRHIYEKLGVHSQQELIDLTEQ